MFEDKLKLFNFDTNMHVVVAKITRTYCVYLQCKGIMQLLAMMNHCFLSQYCRPSINMQTSHIDYYQHAMLVIAA